MDILILFGLIALNGLFAMSEIALVAAKGGRLRKLAEQFGSAQTALKLKDDPTLFLSTIQIGITAIGILSGIWGEAVLSAPILQWLVSMGMERELATVLATTGVVLVITYFAIVVGELVPKRIAQNNAERITVVVAYPIYWLSIATKPFVLLLTFSTNLMLKLLGQKDTNGDTVTEEDIVALVKEGSETGVIELQEQEMIANLLQLNDRMATSLMTPRCEIQYLDIEQPLAEILKNLRQTKHSVWPVCRGGLDNLIGTISSKVLLDEYSELSIERLVKLLRNPRFVPESMKGLSLLSYMQQTSSEMTFLVDEYGDIQGLVTHYDLLTSIAGELAMTTQHMSARKGKDGSWQFDGLIPISVFKTKLNIDVLEGEETEGFQTLNGFLTWLSGRLPEEGEAIYYQRFVFEVVTVKNNRITQVRVHEVVIEQANDH